MTDGPGASRIKRGELAFTHPEQLAALLTSASFGTIGVHTVAQTLVFPSVIDYVRFQLRATPMAVLLKQRDETERQATIAAIAAKTAELSAPAALEDGKFCFPQEAYVAVARSAS